VQQLAQHPQQQQQVKQPEETAGAPPSHTAPQEQPAGQRAAHVAVLLRQQLSQRLGPAIQQRWPAAPAQGSSVWRALQEAAGRLSAQAAAACNKVLGEVAAEALGSDAAAAERAAAGAAEQAVTQLAEQCLAALPPVALPPGGG